MRIHTTGDSHSVKGWPSDIVFHRLGALLCYSFGKEQLDRCDIRNYDIEDGDSLIFCLGEIDCRCHVYKHQNEMKSYMDVIDEIVDNYFEAIKINVLVSEIKFKNIGVYNVVPAIEKYNTSDNVQYPYLGSDEERRNYVVYFNKKLKEKCLEYGYVFFDVYDKYVDDRGYLSKDLSDDNVHIRDGRYISEFIYEHDV